LSVLAAPLVKVATDQLFLFTPKVSSLLGLGYAEGRYDFGRVYRRLLLGLTLLIGYVGWSWLGSIPLRGIGPRDGRWRKLGSGFLLGCLSFTLLLGVLILLGSRTLAPEFPPNWLLRIGLAFGSGLAVGTIEETVFRGLLLGGLLQDHGRGQAVLVSSGLYSLVHFLWAKVPVGIGFDLTIGVQALTAHTLALFRPSILLPFVGLSLVGVVLAYAYLWSGSLLFPIGLHAGWVFLAKIDDLLLLERTGVQWLYGPQGVLGTAMGWLLLLLMLFFLRLWIRPSEFEVPPRL
jgi:membrane protease YdiL (CAAX protease family)